MYPIFDSVQSDILTMYVSKYNLSTVPEPLKAALD